MANLTMLEKYQRAFANLAKQESQLSLGQVQIFQELLYRMEVLQVCQIYTCTAPASGEVREILTHYQMADAYLENLKTERRQGSPASEDEQKQRDTAHQNLCRIVTDYRKRFSSFNPGTLQYKSEICKVITTFLPAWIQVRNSYINITTKEAQQ